MATAQDTLLRILGHMSDLALEFAGRTNVDERLLLLALLEGVFKKRANLVIMRLAGTGYSVRG